MVLFKIARIDYLLKLGSVGCEGVAPSENTEARSALPRTKARSPKRYDRSIAILTSHPTVSVKIGV